MPAIVGWDRALGTLLGAFLRGRAEQQQTETLRKILDQQQRQNRGLDDTMGIASGDLPLTSASPQGGTFGNAPFVSPQDTPYIPNSQFPQPQGKGGGGILGSLGEALRAAGSYTLEGLTPGNAEAGPLIDQVIQAREDSRHKRSLADAISLAKARAQFRQPGFTEQMYQEYAQLHGPEAAMKLWEQNQQGGTGDLLAGTLRNNPQALQDWINKQTQNAPQKPTRLEELRQVMTPEQFTEYLAGMGGGTPQVRDVPTPNGQVQRQGIAPKTGEIKWEQTLPGKPLQAQDRKKLGALQDAYAQMLELENLITDPKTGQMKDVSSYTGWQGTEPLSTMRENFGLKPEELQFRNIVKNIVNTFVRANEGAVVPDPMLQRLEKMSPALSNADASFPVNFQQMKNRIQQAYADTLGIAAGAGFDVSQQQLPQNYQDVLNRIQERNQGTQQKAPSISPQKQDMRPLAARYHITSGVNKGTIVDSKETLMEMIQKGQISPQDTYEERR